MKKNKTKKYKLKNNKLIILILIILIMFIYLVYPKNLSDKKVFNKPNVVNETIIIKDDNIISKTIMDDKYVFLVLNENNNLVSKIIDYKTNKEITFEDILKSNKIGDTNKKISELLYYKYPTAIASLLDNYAEKEYLFYDSYILIKYNLSKDVLDTNRFFDLKIYYNEIKNYLNFEVPPYSYQNEDGFDYDKNKITIVFSFDDGPNNIKTKNILNTLEDYKMSATFFMLGNKLLNDKETVKKVANSHSEVGYHSYEHTYFTKQKITEVKEEYLKSNEIFYNITGKNLKYTRPPYGSYNEKVLKSIDTPFVRWDIDTNDWRYHDDEYIKNYVLENYSDGDIILFHDSYDTTVKAINKLVPLLYNLDVQVLSISEYTKLKNINLENHKMYFNFK
ncbi:MAG: polysaccharide deacetylase family protein [Bacilli bacterium]